MSSDQKSPHDLEAIDSKELFEWLLESRFSGNKLATKSFLTKAANYADEESSAAPEIPEEATTMPNQSISFVSPRSKLDSSFHENFIFGFNTKQGTSLRLERGNVALVVVFPKPEDSHQAKRTDMCLVALKDPIIFKKKETGMVCFQLPVTPPEFNDTTDKARELDGLDHSDQWMEVLRQTFGKPKMHRIFRQCKDAEYSSVYEQSFQFRSHQDSNVSSTTGGRPFVKCYSGVNDGALYPMDQGILFFKPPLFLDRSKLEAISCSRGADSSSRYVDMVVVASGQEYQFTNIHRDELSVLNEYIHKTLIPAMQADIDETGLDNEQQNDAADSADGDHQDDNRSGTRRAPKRKAATDIRSLSKRVADSTAVEQDDDDDDDDVDYVVGGDPSSSDEESENESEGNDSEGSEPENDETESEEE